MSSIGALPTNCLAKVLYFVPNLILISPVSKAFNSAAQEVFSYVWRTFESDPVFASDVCIILTDTQLQSHASRVKALHTRILGRARDTGCPVPEEPSGYVFSPSRLSQLSQAVDLQVFLKAAGLGAEAWAEDRKGLLSLIPTLRLSGRNLHSLPKQIEFCSSLTNLDLSNNKLSSLPTEISKCKKLVKLSLVGNMLKTVSLELSHLRVLNLDRNCLERVRLGGCEKLWHLYLSQNRMKKAPQTEGVKLGVLDLSHNLTASPVDETPAPATKQLVIPAAPCVPIRRELSSIGLYNSRLPRIV